MADLWSDYTDMLITQFDNAEGKNYKISVRDLLSNPLKYLSQEGISATIENMREDVTSFMDEGIRGAADKKVQFDESLQKCDALTAQLSQSIASRAKQNKIPLIKPVSIERNTTEEVINIDEVGSDMLEATFRRRISILHFRAFHMRTGCLMQ